MDLFPHDINCGRKLSAHSDAAKRISDAYNLHRVVSGLDAVGGWFAVHISDGRGDGTLYASRGEAVRHQHHGEASYVFIRLGPAGMSPCEADALLAMHRPARARGIATPDRDHRTGGFELIPRLTLEDQRAQVGALLGKCAPTNLIIGGTRDHSRY